MDFSAFNQNVFEAAIENGASWIGDTPVGLVPGMLSYIFLTILPFLALCYRKIAYRNLIKNEEPKFSKKNIEKNKPKISKLEIIYFGFMAVIFLGYWCFAWGYSFKEDKIRRAQLANSNAKISVGFLGDKPRIDFARSNDPPQITFSFPVSITVTSTKPVTLDVDWDYNKDLFLTAFWKLDKKYVSSAQNRSWGCPEFPCTMVFTKKTETEIFEVVLIFNTQAQDADFYYHMKNDLEQTVLTKITINKDKDSENSFYNMFLLKEPALRAFKEKFHNELEGMGIKE